MAHEDIDSPKLLSVDQLAEALGVSRRTVYRLLEEGDVPHYRVGKHLRFDLDEVKKALRANKSGGNA